MVELAHSLPHPTPATSSLVIVDVQERLTSAMEASVAERVTHNIVVLVSAARRLGIPIFVTEQYPKGLGPTVASVRDALSETLAMNPIFAKLEFAATAHENFRRAFTHASPTHARQHVVLVGMEAHICVYQTARGLRELGYMPHVVSDATCSRSKDNFDTALVLWQQVGALRTSTEAIVFDWLGKAGSEDFKAISRLVK